MLSKVWAGSYVSTVMARPSRPPGFDMTYRPVETRFGPPLRVKIPSFVYVAIAVFAVMIVSWVVKKVRRRRARRSVTAGR